MAVPSKRLGFQAFRHTSGIPARRKAPPFVCPNQAFHTTPLRRRPEDSEASSSSQKAKRQPFKFSLSDFDSRERSAYQSLTTQERDQWREEAQQMHEHMTSPQIESELQGLVSRAVYETAEAVPHVEPAVKRIRPGFFAMGEEEVQDSGEDPKFEGDDIPSLGHGELEQHREMRHYARLAAWEMPLLSSTPCSPSVIFYCSS